MEADYGTVEGEGSFPTLPHPLADEWNQGWNVFVSDLERVSLTAPLWTFLREARASGVRPVLLTSTRAHVSWFVVEEMRACGGYWAARDEAGRVFDASTGYQLSSFAALWGPVDPTAPRLPVFVENDLQRESEGAFFFESFTREIVRAQVQAGLIGERFVAGLGGGMLVRWDEGEPLATPWDRGAVTERVRLQMPVSERQFARSDRNAVINFGVTRTRKGILEHCRGLVSLGRYKAPRGLPPGVPLAGHPAVISTLGEIAEKFRLNVAMVSYCEVVDCGGLLGQIVAPHRADLPLAVLLGPAAVRDLKLNIDDLSTRHDVTQFGTRRVPTLLVRFTGPDDLWEQMMSFGRELDQERLAVALGSSSSPTRRS